MPVLLSDSNSDDKNEVRIILLLVMPHKKRNITRMNAFAPHLLPLTILCLHPVLCVNTIE